MKLKTLISASLLYGFSDMLVLLVSGFLLLPLYTRTLSQADFGIYVVVRANTELLSYLLYLGVPSAMARLYFDYRKIGEHSNYVGTLTLGFTLALLPLVGLIYFFGGPVWELAAPKAPAWPNLWFCFATAALSFYGLTGTTWLRLDEAIRPVVALQVGTAALVALLAWLALAVFGGGLIGLLTVFLFANLPPTIVLAARLWRRFRRRLPVDAIGGTLFLGLPIFFSYLSNFALNRINLFIMQYWVTIEAIAVFGLAVQISSLVTVASMSFNKAVQPVIFRAEREEIAGILARVAPLHIVIMTLTALLFALFVDDLMIIVAPRSYGVAYDVVLSLIFANLVGSFSLIPDTTLMYLKKPQISLGIAIVGGIVSTVVGLALVPLWGAMGAATALIAAYALKTLASQFIAGRHVATNAIAEMMSATAIAAFLFAIIRLLHGLGLPFWMSVGVKSTGLAVAMLAGLAVYLAAKRHYAKGANF